MDRKLTSSVFDKGQPSATQTSHRFSGFIAKALFVIVFALFMPFICCRYVPFFKPVGVFVLGRLWDMLNFVILTTAVSIGIINSGRTDTRKSKHNLRDRRIPGLGAAFFGDMEQEDEEELDLHEEQLITTGSDGQQQKKAPIDDELKKGYTPTTGVLQARKLVTSLMSSVTHIASLGSVIEKLVFNTSRSLEKPNASTKQQPKNAHLTDYTITGGCVSEQESSATISHRKSSSLDRSNRVKPGEAIPRSEEPKNRRNASFSFDYGTRGESNGEEGANGCSGGGMNASSGSTSPSSLTSSSSSSSAAAAPPPERQRSYSISRSVYVIRPSQMSRGGDEGVGTASGSNEVNMRAEAFIAKFRAEMRLQSRIL